METLWGDEKGGGVFTPETKAGLRLDKGSDVGSGGVIERPEGDKLKSASQHEE